MARPGCYGWKGYDILHVLLSSLFPAESHDEAGRSIISPIMQIARNGLITWYSLVPYLNGASFAIRMGHNIVLSGRLAYLSIKVNWYQDDTHPDSLFSWNRSVVVLRALRISEQFPRWYQTRRICEWYWLRNWGKVKINVIALQPVIQEVDIINQK